MKNSDWVIWKVLAPDLRALIRTLPKPDRLANHAKLSAILDRYQREGRRDKALTQAILDQLYRFGDRLEACTNPSADASSTSVQLPCANAAVSAGR